MNNPYFIIELPEINFINNVIKLFFICIYAYYTALKIINIKEIKKSKIIVSTIFILFISIICELVESLSNTFNSLICLIYLLTLVNVYNIKNGIGYVCLITIISLSINYALYIVAVMISFLPNAILNIQNDYISLFIIILIYTLIIFLVSKIKRFKYGILSLQKHIKNEYFDMLILNISIIILFSIIMLQNYMKFKTDKFGFYLIVLIIMMFITIKKSLEIYYKQTLLIKDLEETKKELENKNKEIEKLEEENLKFSKTSHTLAHKQKVLEYKINKLMETKGKSKTEEKEIKDRVEELSKQLYNKPKEMELSKTNIPKIDDIIEYMQSECIKNNIEFELQIVGNIYHMINNLISEEDLETLIADHVKDAIIAINYSKNTNRSILVKLGKIEGCYSLYIYDTGIEFEKETLQNLGKKPVTTHAESGGTGMGFMNTFDTLNKYNASLIINEIDKPSNDNYTKAIIIKFDNKKEFNII